MIALCGALTRAPIPAPKKSDVLPERVYKHTAIIAFEPQFLCAFLEMGEEMKVLVTDIASETIDTPEDLERVTAKMVTDPFWTSGTYSADA